MPPAPETGRASSERAATGFEATLTLGEALTLNPVSEHAWQVCDSRRSPQSPGYLLGFIEAVTDGVELMQFGDTFIWVQFPTLDDALAHIARTAGAIAAERSTGDLAWIG
jgi:hypothetical protein